MKRIEINPLTRLEGHGKIDIFLDEAGEVANAYFQVPELRGFERFLEGRKAEDMPQLTSRICGVCPVAHHMASTRALDAAFGVEPPRTAQKLRELIYCGYIFYDHTLHFYYLGGPDFLVGLDAPPQKRNILGVIEALGEDLGRAVIRHRAYGQRIIEILGGKATHPVFGLPGGVSKSLSEAERKEIESMAQSCVKFAQDSLELFHERVLSNSRYMELIQDPAHTLKLYNMGLVDDSNRLNFYSGQVRVTDPQGKEFLKFAPEEYLEVIGEAVLEWSYVKAPYLRRLGFKGFQDGPENGLYRVGPLGRLNACQGITTKLAQQEYERMFEALGRPAHQTLAYHWARLVELLYAAERALELATDPEITSNGTRNLKFRPLGEGVGIVEAARGTLIHHYQLDPEGLVKRVNLLVATTQNNPALSMSVRNAARSFIHQGEVKEELLNLVEVFFRAYDPCLACASHAVTCGPALEVAIRNHQGQLLRSFKNF
jgi:F420-non-reducing hydrogenase large subunit